MNLNLIVQYIWQLYEYAILVQYRRSRQISSFLACIQNFHLKNLYGIQMDIIKST